MLLCVEWDDWNACEDVVGGLRVVESVVTRKMCDVLSKLRYANNPPRLESMNTHKSFREYRGFSDIRRDRRYQCKLSSRERIDL